MQPEGNWITRAPSLRRKAILLAKVQDEAGHGLYLYCAAETLGADRADLTDKLIERPPEVLLDLQLPDADLRRRRRHRLAGRRRRDLQPGAAVPLLLRPLRAGDDPDLQGGVVPPAAGLRAAADDDARHRRRSGTMVQDADQPLLVAVADDVRPAGRATRPTPRSRWRWGIKRHTNDELRQRFVDMTVPQAEKLGVTLPDPELRWNEERGHYDFGSRRLGRVQGRHRGQRPVQRPAHRHAQGGPRGGRLGPRGRARARRQAPGSEPPEPASERTRADCGGAMTDQGWPLCEVFLRGKRGLNHVHVGSAARRRRRDGAAPRPRPLHPPQRGRQHLGGPAAATSPRPARTRRTRSSTRRRQGLPAPDVLRHPRRRARTCEGRCADMSTPRPIRRQPLRPARRGPRRGPPWAFGTGFTDPLEGSTPSVPAASTRRALARYCLALGDDALIYSQRLQQWWPALPELEEETALANIALDLLGQARLLLARAGRDRRAGPRTHWRSSATRRSSATSGWPSTPTRDFAELVGACWCSPPGGWRCSRRCSARSPTGAGGDRRQGRQGAHLPPRLRGRLGRPARRRHRAVAREDAGGAGRRVAAGRRAVPPRPRRAGQPSSRRRPSAPSSTRCWPRRGLDRPSRGRRWPGRRPAGRDGVHTEAMGYMLAEMQSVARAHPDATW